MRHPVDWMVVSIALLMLAVSQWRGSADLTSAQSATAPMSGDERSPFAYIREDGSEIYLPVNGSRPRGAMKAQISPATTAVFTWSEQPANSSRDLAMLQ